MNLEEDDLCGGDTEQSLPSGLSRRRKAVLEALSPTSRFLSDIAELIHRTNRLRSLPPLSVEMRQEFGLNELPSDEIGIAQLVTKISSFIAHRGLTPPSHLVVLVRQAIAQANEPLISGFPPTSK